MIVGERERDVRAGEAGVVDLDQVVVQRSVVQPAGLADREDRFDEAVAGFGLGAEARFAPQDEEGHRLSVVRGSGPGEVVVTAVEHPLAGSRLVVEGRTTVGGSRCWVVRLPDGTTATIAVAATAVGALERTGGVLLSPAAVRAVRLLLLAVGDDQAGT